MTRMANTNPRQYNVMIQFLEENRWLANGLRVGRGPTSIAAWEEIAPELNSFGPPVRCGREWGKTWKRYKYTLKQKMLRKIGLQIKTSRSPEQIRFTPIEQALIKLLNWKLDEVPKCFTMARRSSSWILESTHDADAGHLELPDKHAEEETDDVAHETAPTTSSQEKDTLEIQNDLLDHQIELANVQMDISNISQKRITLNKKKLEILKELTEIQREGKILKMMLENAVFQSKHKTMEINKCNLELTKAREKAK